MLYTIWTVKGNDYKLRLNAKACVDLEKKLGTNALNIFVGLKENELPSLTPMLLIIQAGMSQYQHNMNLDAVYDIYDDYVDEGHTLADLVPLILDIFKVSGFYKEQDLEEEKN